MLLSQQHTIIWYGKFECWAGMIVRMFSRLWLRLHIAHFWQHSQLQAKWREKDSLFLTRWNIVNLGIREEKRCHLQNRTEGTALGRIHHKVERWCSAACPSHPQERAHPLLQLSPKEPDQKETAGVISKLMSPLPGMLGWWSERDESELCEVHPIPKVDDTLTQLAGATLFSKLGTNSGF